MRNKVVQVVYDTDTDESSITVNGEIPLILGALDGLITTVVEQLGVDRDELLDNFREPTTTTDNK